MRDLPDKVAVVTGGVVLAMLSPIPAFLDVTKQLDPKFVGI